MARIHVGVGILGRQQVLNVEGGRIAQVLLHAREVRPGPHTGLDATGICRLVT